MAYAALISLKRALDQILLHPDRYFMPCEKKYVESLCENLDFLKNFFEAHHSHIKRNETVGCLERRIRDVVYEAQDIVDIHQIYPSHDISIDYANCSTSTEPERLTDVQTEEHIEMKEYAMKIKNGDLKTVFKEIDSIKEEIHLINKEESMTVTHILQLKPVDDDAQSWRAKFGSDSKNSMVGFDDLRMQIKDHLTGEPSTLQVISVVGMGGIGKTTLAINVYNDPYIVTHFDIRAWVTVSQSYCTRNILLDLLDSMTQLTPQISSEESDDLLECHLHKSLKEKRYFIIIDDIWDIDAWDSVRRLFPNDNNGSRIMLTTRVKDVAAYATSSDDHLYRISPLSDDSSWILLCAKLFGSESCPDLDLEEIGMNIAQKCKGLPLSITVIAGLLSKINKTREAWQAVAEDINSLMSSNDDLCTEILKMSYNYLPQHLKSCFLYIAIFPEDHEIDVTKLTNLWIAEGFLDGVRDQSLEDVAERYLGELIDRSLLSMSIKKANGKMKTCRIHDLLLNLCVKESKCEKILQITKSQTNLFPEFSTGQRRVSIHWSGGFRKIKPPASSSLVRSLICMGRYGFVPSVLIRFKLLRVLDVIQVAFNQFPEEVLELVHLRYIAFRYRGSIPSSLSKLFNLQTLLITSGKIKFYYKQNTVYLPSVIWKMKHLRHLQFTAGYLHHLYRSSLEVSNNDAGDLVLEELQSILGIWNLRFGKELIRRIPNIRKLYVTYNSFHSIFSTYLGCYEFENLAKLRQLKELKINIHPSLEIMPNLKFAFPKSLETLSLRGCKIPWKDLSIVGSLPHLQVLKLKFNACVGEEWEPKEGEFCELKVLELLGLELRRWNAESHHFPTLEHLIVGRCKYLREIPLQFGESSTLNKIELMECEEGDIIMASARKIKEIQYELGNQDFQLVRHSRLNHLFEDSVLNNILK